MLQWSLVCEYSLSASTTSPRSSLLSLKSAAEERETNGSNQRDAACACTHSEIQ